MTVFKPLWRDYHKLKFEKSLGHIRCYKRPIEDIMRVTYNHSEQESMDNMEIRRLLQQVDKDTFDFQRQEMERQERNLNAVRDWIAPTETETDHNNICRDRSKYQNSGEWILDSTQIKEWMHVDHGESSGSILWVNGRPGAGKIVQFFSPLPFQGSFP